MRSDYLPGPTDQGIKIARAGAILGARSHSRRRTTMDAHGAQTAVLGVKAAPADQSGRLVETYGSEGRLAAAKTTCSTLGPLTPSQAVTNAVVVSVASFLPVPRGVRPGDCAYSGRREPQ